MAIRFETNLRIPANPNTDSGWCRTPIPTWWRTVNYS